MSSEYLSLLASMTAPPKPVRPPPDASAEVKTAWSDEVGAWEMDRQSRDLQRQTLADEDRAREERAAVLTRLDREGIISDFYTAVRLLPSGSGGAGAGAGAGGGGSAASATTPSTDQGSSLLRHEIVREVIDFFDTKSAMLQGSVLFSTILRRRTKNESWGLALTHGGMGSDYALVEAISKDAEAGFVDLGNWKSGESASSTGAGAGAGAGAGVGNTGSAAFPQLVSLPSAAATDVLHRPLVPPPPPQPIISASTMNPWFQTARGGGNAGGGGGGSSRGGKRGRSTFEPPPPPPPPPPPVPSPRWLLKPGDHLIFPSSQGTYKNEISDSSSGDSKFNELASTDSDSLILLVRVRRLTPDGRLVQESFSRGRNAGGPIPRPEWLGKDAQLYQPLRSALVGLLKAEKMALNAKFLKLSRPWVEQWTTKHTDELQTAVFEGNTAVCLWATGVATDVLRVRTAIAMAPKDQRIPGA